MGKKFFGRKSTFVADRPPPPAGTTSKINKVLNCRTWHWRMSRHWQEMKVEKNNKALAQKANGEYCCTPLNGNNCTQSPAC